MPETRQEPCRNDKNPLKHWNICKKIAPAAHRPPIPQPKPVGGPQNIVLSIRVSELTDSAIIITTSCMWHAVLQLHQLLYRYMTLYITPERTDLRRLVDIMLLRYNVMHLLSEGVNKSEPTGGRLRSQDWRILAAAGGQMWCARSALGPKSSKMGFCAPQARNFWGYGVYSYDFESS